jgi:hypothetical protein
MDDRSPGRRGAAPEAAPCSATPRRGVNNPPAAKQAPRARAPLVTTPTPPAAAAPRPPAAPAATRDQVVTLATQGAYVLLLDHDTGEPLCEPTHDPAAIARAWHAHRHYRPRPALVATKHGAAVQPPAGVEAWWPPRGWRPGVPVLDLPASPAPARGPAAARPVHPPPPPAAPASALLAAPPPRPARRPVAPPQWVTLHPTSGKPLPSFANALAFLRAEWGDDLWLDQMTGVVMLGRDAMSDGRLGDLRERAECAHDVRFSAQALGEALTTLAERRPRHPVREYLEALCWDGAPRLATLAATLCRAPTALDEAIVRCFVVQAVARVLDPGCKADCCFVLYGEQGTRKSSALRALAGAFFSDGDLPDNARDQGQLLRLSWIHELGEIDRYLAARSQATVKATLSRGRDDYRPPYSRHPIRVDRTYVLTGTTNQRRFLTDPTGNRRYWIVEAPAAIDTAWITAHRDQLWAEAVVVFRREGYWWLTREQEHASAGRNADYTETDALEELVAHALEGKHETTVLEVCTAVLTRGLTSEAAHDHAATRARTDRGLQIRVGAALTRLGWEQGPRRRIGPRESNHRVRPWTPKDP